MSGLGKAVSLPWCRRCPRGHTTIKRASRSSGDYKCESCRVYYSGDPLDAREVESFPLDESEIEHLTTCVVGERETRSEDHRR